MIKLLKYRAALLSVLFGLFGRALSQLLVIEEMSWYYTALASLIALVVNLLVSFMLKGRWSRQMKNNTKIICLLLFIGLILTSYLHTRHYIMGTFAYKDYQGQLSYHVKGDELTQVAQKFLQEHPYIESDTDLVQEGFGSPAEKDKIWKPDSIQKMILKLITSYSLVVIFFVSLISVLLEVLMGHYGKTTHKTLEAV